MFDRHLGYELDNQPDRKLPNVQEDISDVLDCFEGISPQQKSII